MLVDESLLRHRQENTKHTTIKTTKFPFVCYTPAAQKTPCQRQPPQMKRADEGLTPFLRYHSHVLPLTTRRSFVRFGLRFWSISPLSSIRITAKKPAADLAWPLVEKCSFFSKSSLKNREKKKEARTHKKKQRKRTKQTRDSYRSADESTAARRRRERKQKKTH